MSDRLVRGEVKETLVRVTKTKPTKTKKNMDAILSQRLLMTRKRKKRGKRGVASHK